MKSLFIKKIYAKIHFNRMHIETRYCKLFFKIRLKEKNFLKFD